MRSLPRSLSRPPSPIPSSFSSAPLYPLPPSYPLASTSTAQEYKGELCLDGTPFCWVPLGKAGDCAAACARAAGPQRAATDAGDALSNAAGARSGAAPHFVCRARGDSGEGSWRAGFNLKAGAGPAECAVAAGGTEEVAGAGSVECLCHAPPSSAGGLGPGSAPFPASLFARAWDGALIALASFAGALAATRAGGGGWGLGGGGHPGGGAGGSGGGHGHPLTATGHFRPGGPTSARHRRASHTGLSSMLLLPVNGHGHGSDEEGGGEGQPPQPPSPLE